MTSPALREEAAGGVLVSIRDSHLQVCLVRRGRHQRQAWCLPKGHLEAGEDAAAAAHREVQEETGWSGKILQALEPICYQFPAPGGLGVVSKTVSFFLMRATKDEGPHDAQEVEEVRWMTFEEAMQLATYENERQVLRQAHQIAAQLPPETFQ